jgi:outer membrane protein TolC
MYEQALLTSIQELNDAMIQTKTTKANLKKSEEDYSLENQKYILAEKQYEIGDSSKLDEMKANLNLLITEQRHVSSVINDVISTISLYNAVGGVDYTQEKYTNL